MRGKITTKKVKTLLLILMMLMIGAMGYYIYQEHHTKDPFKEDANSLVGIMPGMSDKQIQERLNKVLDENMMNITINPKPVFENGSAAGKLCIENIKQNHVNFIVTIKLDKDAKQIYETGLLRPNHYIEKAKLDMHLKKGIYDATAYFKGYDNNKKFVGSSMVKLQITVLN